MQLIRDNNFKNGFIVVSQKQHDNNEYYYDKGEVTYYPDTKPIWQIAQWDSGPCLWDEYEKLKGSISNPFEITDGKYKKVVYDPNEESVLLSLDSSGYYRGKGCREGDYWPHLLLAQSVFGFDSASDEDKKKYFLTSGMKLDFDIALCEYTQTPYPDDWVEADQFYLYLYIRSRKNNDFVWFGLSLFDSRAPRTDYYYNIDGGKDDASGLMIYVIGGKKLYPSDDMGLWNDGKPNPSGEYRHIGLDLADEFERMYELGTRDGHISSDFSDLYIDGMNIGFETIGTFSSAIKIKNLSLVNLK